MPQATPALLNEVEEIAQEPLRLIPPLVSVVISNYNYGRFLNDAVRSVRSQTYTANECIVVDDCSTDESATVLAQLARQDTRLKIVRLPTNSGQSAAALAGLSVALGDFVLLLDADDILFPECIARHVALHLSSRRAVGFSCCNAVQMDSEGRVVGRWANLSSSFSRLPFDPMLMSSNALTHLPWHGAELSPITPESVRCVPWSNTAWPWTSTSSMLFRRDALDLIREAEGFADLRIGTDNFLAHFVNHLSSSLILDETLVGYRLHGSNNFNKRPALENFVCHNKVDEHYWTTRRLILDDLMVRFEHYARNMEDPSHIFRICRLLDMPDLERGLPRWAARSRFSRLIVEQRHVWSEFISRKETLALIAMRRLPYPWRRIVTGLLNR